MRRASCSRLGATRPGRWVLCSRSSAPSVGPLPLGPWRRRTTPVARETLRLHNVITGVLSEIQDASSRSRRFSEAQLAGEVDIAVSASLIEALVPHPQLRARFADIIEGVPFDAFRVECLRPVGYNSGNDWTTSEPLFYELYGEKLVAAGHYEKVICYSKHMLPLAQAIRAKTEREEICVRYAS